VGPADEHEMLHGLAEGRRAERTPRAR
jgi:hypothetical protein